MVIFKLVELLLATFVFWVLISQIIIPAARGTLFFPMWRKEAKLVDKIVDLNQKEREKHLEEIIKEKEGDSDVGKN
jgi:hypothetical protein